MEKGITQAKLAEALGRPQSFIAKVENGERKLDVVEFAVIARLLGVGAGAVIERIGGRFHSCNRTYDLRITNALISTYPGAMSKLGTP